MQPCDEVPETVDPVGRTCAKDEVNVTRNDIEQGAYEVTAVVVGVNLMPVAGDLICILPQKGAPFWGSMQMRSPATGIRFTPTTTAVTS